MGAGNRMRSILEMKGSVFFCSPELEWAHFDADTYQKPLAECLSIVKYSMNVSTWVHAAVMKERNGRELTPLSALLQEASAFVRARTSRIRSNQCPLPPSSDSQVVPESLCAVLCALLSLQCRAR